MGNISTARDRALQTVIEYCSRPEPERRGEAIIYNVPLTLNEVLQGGTKVFGYTRNVRLQNDSVQVDVKTISIQFVAGVSAGTRMVFPGVGDFLEGNSPGDVIIIIQDMPHERFRREGCDIVYTLRMNEEEYNAMTQLTTVQVPTLGGQLIELRINNSILNVTQPIKVKGFGLPNQNMNMTKGDLIVEIEVVQPVLQEGNVMDLN